MQLINIITSAVSLSLISAQANFPNVMQSCQTMGYCNNGNDDQCNACQLNLGYINQAYNQANGFQQGQSGYVDPQIPTASPVAPTTVATSAPQENTTTGNPAATTTSSGDQSSQTATATQSQSTTDASQTQTSSTDQSQQTSTTVDPNATTTASASQTAATSTTTRSSNSSTSTTTAGNNASKVGGSIILGAVGLLASFLY